ncbi:MAG: cell division protein ZapE [Gammaproteobacteria bacterium]|nr:cell division protein ZapE [Gammaproteobacteria bacterium]
MTPIEYYQKQVEEKIISYDVEQINVLNELQIIYFNLIAENKKRSSLLGSFYKNKLVQGLYIYGGVGIGKTHLMDIFFQTLPFKNKMRMHFHEFMQHVHARLTYHQGKKDPLQFVAKEISQKALVLCFDEFFVSDITDAMLLGRLFKILFSKGVCLVATSNVKPDDLYKHGLQRINFLPAIKLIKSHMKVIFVPALVDYRLRYLKSAGVFYTPLNEHAHEMMEKTFSVLAGEREIDTVPVIINHRPIHSVKHSEDIIWFEFKDICSVPRSQKDYLAIAKNYKTVCVSNVPIIEPREKDTIVLFINMVDVFYDAHIQLILSATAPVTELYTEGFKVFEYARTQSRLLEMQSQDYFMKKPLSNR